MLQSAITVSNCAFNNNQGGGSGFLRGGAIWMDVDAIILACTFDGNSGLDGGAIWINDGSPIISTGCVFTNNVAEQGVGGAIALTADGQREAYTLAPFSAFPWLPDDTSAIIPSTLDLSDNRILNNTAGTDSGGIFINSIGELNTFTGNNIRRNDPSNCSGCD